jgi:hypothetical protein
MANGKDHDTTLITVTGTPDGDSYLLTNLAPPDHDPESIWSVIYRNGEDDLEAVHEVEAWLTALRATPNGRLLATSMDGELLTGTSGKWTTRDLDCENGLNDLWVIDDSLAVAVGETGERVLLRAKRSETERDSKQRRLNRVRGTSIDRIYAIGDDGLIWFFDGRTWTEQPSPTNHALFGLLLTASQVWVGGADGVLFELGRQSWRELEIPNEITVHALAEFGGQIFAACGEDGLWVLQRDKLTKVKDYALYDLQPASGKLWGTGGTLLAEYDGKQWLKSELDI